MFSWFRPWAECFRARRADSHLDFESELLSRAAERKAQLMRRAARYEVEGLTQVAQELRACAEILSFEKPLSSLLLPTTITSVTPASVTPASVTSSNGTAPRSMSRPATK